MKRRVFAPDLPKPQTNKVRCPVCQEVLFHVSKKGGEITIKCRHCRSLVRWDGSKAELVISDE